MPCYDDRDHRDIVYVVSRKHAAFLCAVFKVLEHKGILNEVLNTANWKEAGVSQKEVENWWVKHKKKDAAKKDYHA